MSTYNGPHTALSRDDMAKVPAGPHSFISWAECGELMDYPSGSRPRVFGYVERGDYAGQTVAIRSRYDMERYGDSLGFVWVSHATLSDFVQSA